MDARIKIVFSSTTSSYSCFHKHVEWLLRLFHSLHFPIFSSLLSHCSSYFFALSSPLMSEGNDNSSTDYESKDYIIKEAEVEGVFKRATDPWRLRQRWHHHRSDVPQYVPKTSRSFWRRNLQSCLSSSSMSHDKTWKPVICSDYVTNKVKKFRDKTLKANKLGLFWTKRRSNPRWLSSGNSKTRTPGWLWQKKKTKIKWNDRVAAKKNFTTLKLKNCNDEITNFFVKSCCSKTGSSWSSWESPNKMKELKRFRLPHSTQSQEEDGSKPGYCLSTRKKVNPQDSIYRSNREFKKTKNLFLRTIPRIFVILRRQGALGDPMFPISCDCYESLWNARSLTHKIYIVLRETFLKIFLHQRAESNLICKCKMCCRFLVQQEVERLNNRGIRFTDMHFRELFDLSTFLCWKRLSRLVYFVLIYVATIFRFVMIDSTMFHCLPEQV